MNRDPLPARILAMSLPYLSVLVGMYWLSNGLLAIALYMAGMGVWLLVVPGTKTKPSLRRGGRGAGITLAIVVFGAAGGALLHLLWPVLGLEPRWEFLRATLGLTGWRWPIFLLGFAIPNAILEEAVWRGRLAGTGRGLETGDLAFALYHALVLRYFLAWPWVLTAVVMLVLTAWVWRRVARATGGLLLPTLSHTAAATSLSLVLYLHS
jgi:hypothetical protein